ncbi:MAG: DUF2490 domain-containing protein [Flavobacteriales bacterium]|nr:DUF2490 domain-containing protein [Flavobacteriales bacterium]
MKKILLLLFLGSYLSFAQVSDANLWTGLGVNADLNDQFSLAYETQTRFFNNFSQLGNYYNELGVKYKPLKDVKIAVKYRYARKYRSTFWDSENRFNIDAAYRYKIKPAKISLTARARYQVSFNRLGVINDVIYPRIKHTGRLKFTAKYRNKDLKLIRPFVSTELFTALNPKNPISALDAYRFSAGVTFNLPKKLELDLAYIFERENGSVLENAHIYMIQLNYSLPNKLLGGVEDK